mgnify:CR=1 FL=1
MDYYLDHTGGLTCGIAPPRAADLAKAEYDALFGIAKDRRYVTLKAAEKYISGRGEYTRGDAELTAAVNAGDEILDKLWNAQHRLFKLEAETDRNNEWPAAHAEVQAECDKLEAEHDAALAKVRELNELQQKGRAWLLEVWNAAVEAAGGESPSLDVLTGGKHPHLEPEIA